MQITKTVRIAASTTKIRNKRFSVLSAVGFSSVEEDDWIMLVDDNDDDDDDDTKGGFVKMIVE